MTQSTTNNPQTVASYLANELKNSLECYVVPPSVTVEFFIGGEATVSVPGVGMKTYVSEETGIVVRIESDSYNCFGEHDFAEHGAFGLADTAKALERMLAITTQSWFGSDPYRQSLFAARAI